VRQIAVFNTNVLFSATGWKGNPYRCVELARAGAVEGVTCFELLTELTSKRQSKLRFTSEQTDDTVVDLLSFLTLVPITGQFKAVALDPDDDKTIESAVVAGATHIVTGDRRHLLPMGSYQGIAIVSPSDFLATVAAP
jgi:putative PIN family toxin of toxin-antitoxin system